MERETTFARSSHNDYVASEFLKACGFTQVEFTTREVPVDDARVVLLHCKGIRKGDGLRLDMDLWPNRNQTAEDIKAMGSVLQDAIIRFGYYEEVDPMTGEVSTVSGKPKFVEFFKDGKWCGFSGSPKKFGDSWNNSPADEPEDENDEGSESNEGRAVA